MEPIPVDFCDNTDSYVHLNQSQSECAFEHQCDSLNEICPLQNRFIKRTEEIEENNEKLRPSKFYIDLL